MSFPGCLLFGFFVLIQTCLQAQNQPGQNVSLRGVIVDSLSMEPLANASVSLVATDKAELKEFQLAKRDGRFLFMPLAKGNYQLTVTFVGYQPFILPVSIPSEKAVDVGSIRLQLQPIDLREVIVRSIPPVSVKRDTLIYNADSFGTPTNAVVEDLLKKLPGVEIVGEGLIRVQGQIIQQVLVNGKPFFGRNSTMATRNLLASLIEKIQVYDMRSDQTAFSGVDDGERSKTINIITKRQGSTGQFGQQFAGLGTDGRFQAGGSLNRFSSDTQLSFVGQTNNIGHSGNGPFGREVLSGGGQISSTGQSPGLAQPSGEGFNYSSRWGKYLDVTANCMISNVVTQVNQTTQRQSVFPSMVLRNDSTKTSYFIRTLSQSNRSNRSGSPGIGLQLTFRPDSMNIIKLTPGASMHITHSLNQVNLQSVSDEQPLLNQSEVNNRSDGISWNLTNSLLWMHRFQQQGHTLSVNLNTFVNQLATDGVNRAQSMFSALPTKRDAHSDTFLNQASSGQIHSITHEAKLSFSAPIAPKHMLELHYSLRTNQGKANREVVDVDSTTISNQKINYALSSRYQTSFVDHQLGITWQTHQSNYSGTFGIDVQRAVQQLDYRLSLTPFNRAYVNILPNIQFKPRLSPNRFLQFAYRSRFNAPSIDQLQPAADVSNPLFIRVGNPALRPEFSHIVTINYNCFQTSPFNNIYALLNVSSTNHRITNAIKVDTTGIQTIRPINTHGHWTANGSVSINRQIIGGLAQGTLNWTTNMVLNRGISYINDKVNRTLVFTLEQDLSMSTAINQVAELRIMAKANFQSMSSSMQKGTIPSLNTSLAVQLQRQLPSKIKFSTDLAYQGYFSRSEGYSQRYYSWNMYISRSFLKQSQAELRIQGIDLLNQNRNLNRIVTDAYIEDVFTRVLKRFVLISFIYTIRPVPTDV